MNIFIRIIIHKKHRIYFDILTNIQNIGNEYILNIPCIIINLKTETNLKNTLNQNNKVYIIQASDKIALLTSTIL